MTDNNNEQYQEQESLDSQSNESQASLGTILQQAREAKGLSVGDVAKSLHLTPTIISEIEADRFAEIGSSTYVRGYVRNYARILDLPNSAILPGLEKQVPTVNEHSMQSFSRKTSRQARDSRLMLVTYLIAGVLLVLLVIWWVQKYSLFSGIDFSKPTVEEVAASSAPAMQQTTLASNEPLVEPVEDEMQAGIADSAATHSAPVVTDSQPQPMSQEVASLAEQVPSSAQPSTELVANAVQSVTDTSVQDTLDESEVASDNSESQKPNAVLAQLEMSVSGECWINALDATGKVLIDGVKKAGREISVSGTPPFKVILGAPKVVSIRFNGESVDMSQFPATRVARFSLPLEQ